MPAEYYVLDHGGVKTLEEVPLLEYRPDADPRRTARRRIAVARAIATSGFKDLDAAIRAKDLKAQLAAEAEIDYATKLHQAAHGQLVVLRRTAGLRVGQPWRWS